VAAVLPVAFTTVIWAGESVLISPPARAEVPAVSERSTSISATPTTIPETVKAVLTLRLRRLLKAIPMEEDMIFSVHLFV
jgi:hypothetical protein